MKSKEIPIASISLVMFLLSVAEIVIYPGALFLGRFLQTRLISVNIFAAILVAIVYCLWPFVDTNFYTILALSMGKRIYINIIIMIIGLIMVSRSFESLYADSPNSSVYSHRMTFYCIISF